MATARLGHADLLLRDHDVAWRAVGLLADTSKGRIKDVGIGLIPRVIFPPLCIGVLAEPKTS